MDILAKINKIFFRKKKNDMAERQQHGFKFEQLCKEKYKVILAKNYTNRFDGKLNNLPVSIKCEKLGSDIELADYFRNSQITEDFYMIVGFWKDTKENIVETHLLKINGQEFHQLFNLSFNERFQNLLDNITNDYSDDIKWKQAITSLKKEWKLATSNLIRPRFKRDHKTQKRIQCAINNNDFYNYFVKNYEEMEEVIDGRNN